MKTKKRAFQAYCYYIQQQWHTLIIINYLKKYANLYQNINLLKFLNINFEHKYLKLKFIKMKMARENTKILVVMPRYILSSKKNYEYAFPLGIGYISASLKKAGFDVDCLNLNHEKGSIKSIMTEHLNKKRYNFVCTGHFAYSYGIVEKIINSVREHKNKHMKFILGGPIITSEPELIFNSLKPDFGVLGEGEITVVKLLDCITQHQKLNKVNGICYSVGGKIKFTKPREIIKNLDEIPYPDVDGFGYEEQLKNMGNNFLVNVFDYPRCYTILGSRGCPYNCTFCYHSLGYKYRTRSVDSIAKEIEYAIKKYKANVFNIVDDLFAVNKERVYEFCKKIKKVFSKIPYECKWFCQLTVNDVDEKMLKTLKDAGCYLISYGLESYSDIVLKSMKKPITSKKIDRAIKLTRKCGLGIEGNFIFGDKAETKESAYKTLNYWKKNANGQIQVGFIQPYPNSEIWQHCVKKGIIKDKLWYIKNKMAHQNWLNMTDLMTDKEIAQLKKDIVRARAKYMKFVVPISMKKIGGKYKYDIKLKCPFCKQTIRYKNIVFRNKYVFGKLSCCRNCFSRFYLSSRLFKFQSDHYDSLDFFRRNYLRFRDNVLTKFI